MVEARIAEVDPAVERRRSRRQPVEVDAQVREMGAEGTEARLVNVSAHGFSAEVPGHEFDTGTRIWLIIPGRDRASAMIKWVAGDRLGAEFFEPVDLADLVGLER
ncbi:PilZ domain-containing protein [Sphingomicrobium astaxanthinifaciens]|uniref:PilZ domain-containing protein n=1 Tax=Sphingomicrobium astaxanthinifaciens TaxID=1227949 RepID=UPI001FCB6811|nr:PilZ domain-containing protein [Sphingomicrobium astaxanthinifaciens]MCJ7421003.1 PilZ domain-containing protein [Sphingomicrobium astaxanthinifaciens]